MILGLTVGEVEQLLLSILMGREGMNVTLQ